MTTTPEDAIEQLWRSKITARCGGADFDKQGGYEFSAMIAAEERLSQANRPGDPASALIAMSVADPTWKMHRDAAEAMMAYFERCPWATRYTDVVGIRVCEAAGILRDTHDQLADWLNRRFGGGQNPFTRDWVRLQPGAIKRALSKTMPTLLLDGKSDLVFPMPGYGVMKSPKNRNDAHVVERPLRPSGDGCWEIDLDEVGHVLTAQLGRQRVFYVNRPENPIGCGYSKAEWQTLLSWAMTYNVTLVVDEAYAGLRYNDRTCSVLEVEGWERCCIVLQSISKPWSATGLRFGWIIAHPVMIRAIHEVLDSDDSGLFGLTIVAGLTCLQHPEWADGTLQRYHQLHQVLSTALGECGFAATMPEAGLCQVTPAPKSADGVEFKDARECVEWLRTEKRLSLMAQTINGQPYLRWALTLQPVPECELADDEAVIAEVVRRLKTTKFEF
jgi:aspartate/methionine/tyrosine aminotransferase